MATSAARLDEPGDGHRREETEQSKHDGKVELQAVVVSGRRHEESARDDGGERVERDSPVAE
jgi:hypothetical protein